MSISTRQSIWIRLPVRHVYPGITFTGFFDASIGTPHQYLTFKRIDRARRMLAEDCTVGEVCMLVGFESIGSFSVLFKKEIGIAPGEYRESVRLRNEKAAEQPRRVIPFCFIAEIIGEEKQ